MISSELKLLATISLLACLPSIIDAGKVELFRITSNVTMQRKWPEGNSITDVREERKFAPLLDDILNSYLQSSNDDANTQWNELTKNMNISSLKDVYINTCDTQMILQNVNFNNFDAFLNLPVEVESKIKDISNHHTAQIFCSMKTDVMSLTGEMILHDSNYSFIVNLTQPTLQVEKNVSYQISSLSGPSSGGRLESFAFEDFTIVIQPKDMYSVVLKKNELRTSILQRVADTWLPVIVDSMNYLLLPKIRQHEKLMTEDSKKLFIKSICYLLSQQNETRVPKSDSFDSFILKGLSNFTHCGGDVMVVKKFESSEMYTSHHTISLLLNYNHSSLLIKKESKNVYSTSTTLYESTTGRNKRRNSNSCCFFPDYSSSTPPPSQPSTTQRPCTEIYIKNIEATISFEVEKGKTKIKRILKTDFDFRMDESPLSPLDGCAYPSMINEIKSSFSEYLLRIGQ